MNAHFLSYLPEVIIYETEIVYDFTFNNDFGDRGQYSDGQVFIRPTTHESIQELYDSIIHESIHAAIDELEESTEPFVFKEHYIINKMMWAEEYV